ncbi:MAG: prepilin-type N-terminal cleavage/methylation domain-containing protein [Halothiobacillaceae bacterium]
MHKRLSAGFTLVEVLVAMAVLSLIIVALAGVMRTTSGTLERVEDAVQRTENIRAVARFLRGSLSQARNLLVDTGEGGQRLHFFSDGQSIEWIAPLPHAHPFGGMHVHRISLVGSELRFQSVPYELGGGLIDWTQVESRQLLDEVAFWEVRCEYVDEARRHVDETCARGRMPDAVSIRVAHAGRYWPELIVGVRQ